MLPGLGEVENQSTSMSVGPKTIITLIIIIVLILILIGLILLAAPLPCSLLDRIMGPRNSSCSEKCDQCTNCSEKVDEMTASATHFTGEATDQSTGTNTHQSIAFDVTTRASKNAAEASDNETDGIQLLPLDMTPNGASNVTQVELDTKSSLPPSKIPPESLEQHTNSTSESILSTKIPSTVHHFSSTSTGHEMTSREMAPSTPTGAKNDSREDRAELVEEQVPGLQSGCKRILSFIDNSFDPCDNFYHFACGNFKTKSKVGSVHSYDLDQRDTRDLLIADLSTQSSRPEVQPLEYIRRFFHRCIDEETPSMEDWEPMAPLTDDVSLSPPAGREKAISASIINQVPTVLSLSIKLDPADPERRIIELNHPSSMISMNDLKANNSDHAATKRRSAYKEFLRKAIRASPNMEPENEEDDLNAVWALETALADISSSEGDSVRTTSDRLHYEGLNLTAVLEDLLGEAQVTTVLIRDPMYLKQLPKVLDDHRISLRRYCDLKAIATHGWAVSRTITNALSEFSQVKEGLPRKLIRRDKCLDVLISNAPLIVGRAYIDRANFTQQDKTRAEEFVDQLKESILTTINEKEWMDEETKKHACEKVRRMEAQVGYPEWIRDDNRLTLSWPLKPPANDSLFEFLQQMQTHASKEQISLIRENKPISDEWLLSPALPKGGYHWSRNLLLLPAATLFDRDRCLFGGVPPDIGTEIIFAIDTKGASIDEHRRRQNWWTEPTVKEFTKLTQSIIHHHPDIVEPVSAASRDTWAAYLGGIRVMHRAIFGSNGTWRFNPHPRTTLPPGVMFFLSYAYLWCANPDLITNESEEQLFKSKWEYRTNMPLRNFEKFSEAFSCPQGSQMNPPTKVKVW